MERRTLDIEYGFKPDSYPVAIYVFYLFWGREDSILRRVD